MDEKTVKNKKTWWKQHRVATVFIGFLILLVAAAAVMFIDNHDNNADTSTTTPAKHSEVFAEVRISGKGFEPAELTVKRGTKVVWVNNGSTLRQIASNPYPSGSGSGPLKSEILNKGQAYTYTANKTGTFGYHDQLHPTINGTLVVKP
jgi:plastocyanin